MSDGAITITIPPEIQGAARDEILAAVGASGAVVDQAEAAPAAPSFGDAIDAAAQALPQFGDAIGAWLTTVADRGMSFPTVMLLCFLSLAVAYGVERALALALAGKFGGTKEAESFSARARNAFVWFVGRLIAIGVFWVIATAIARILLPDHAIRIIEFVLGLVAYQRVVYTVFAALAGPGAAWRRPSGLSDEDARRLMRTLAGLLVIGAVVRTLIAIIGASGAGASGALPTSVLALIQGGVLITFFIAARRPVRELISKAFGDRDSIFRRLSEKYWHLVYAGLAVINALALSAGALGLALGTSLGASVNHSILIAVLTPFVIAGLSAWRDERIAQPAPLSAPVSPTEGDAAPAETPAPETPRAHALVIGGVALAKGLISVGAGIYILRAWGLDPLAAEQASGVGRIIAGVVEAAFVLVVTFALWRALIEILDVWAPLKSNEPGAPAEEVGGAGGTRLETIAPILRGAALGVFVVVGGLLALSSLGVDIAPLLAGAGVLGLAIGFGAQKLVSDVISGVFYLYEDAFRIGEYIQTADGKGVVESISLRSAVLRHPRGALYTVPFSSMGTIQNHSRDWVKVKFSFEVPQDTDLEKVRKLVKKAGAAMVDDPELEGKIIEPMKSQGALGIRGRAWEIGVKFVTKPGGQFVVRRKAMAALQAAFAANQIELMTPRIMFDATQDASGLASMVAGGAAAGEP